MNSTLLIIVAVFSTLGAVILCALLYSKWKQYQQIRKLQESRLKWKKEHRNTLTGNFVMTHTTPIDETYDVQEYSLLGKGSYGVVLVGVHKETKIKYAIKLVNAASGKRHRIEREYKLLKDIDHPNIVRLFAVYDTPDEVGFVMELCTGGSVASWLERLQFNTRNGLPELTARSAMRQLLSAIAHMHDRGICHRDIKLQNIMREHAGWNAQIMLIDFGLGTRFIGATPMKTRCGTLYATAPEVLRESYDERCDVWSAGVVAFTLLSGRKPFEALLLGDNSDGKCSMMANILMGRYQYRSRDWKKVSATAMDFTQKMLTHDYKQRWSAQEALEHPWFQDKHMEGDESEEEDDEDVRERESLPTRRFSSNSIASETSSMVGGCQGDSSAVQTAMKNLKRQTDVSVLHQTSMLAMAYNMTMDKAADKREIFQSFDKDKNGTLSREEFHSAMQASTLFSPDSSQLTEQDIDTIFDAVDANGDNQISFTEFLAATLDPRDFDIQAINTAFQLLDTDKKGYITFNDMERVLSVTSAARRRSMSHAALQNHINSAQQNIMREEESPNFSSPFSFRGADGSGESSMEHSDDHGAYRGVIPKPLSRGRSRSMGNVLRRSSLFLPPLSATRRFSMNSASVAIAAASLSGDSQHSNSDIKIKRKKSNPILPILPSKSSSYLYSKASEKSPTADLDSTSAEQIHRAIKMFDVNGTGVVSYADFLLALTTVDANATVESTKSVQEVDSFKETMVHRKSASPGKDVVRPFNKKLSRCDERSGESKC
mmetsp:Transcript_13046/g.19672  ORF Transcript_13046/g.19672 Transcript_13046/m.19672 type:complete len:772 (+) Transcript_13046:194-2509(+)